ncbi:phosphomannomutase/phosphoglucomutase [Clostridium tetani]|uniref:Phosphomannomutase/phosphoglucomutase n=1 Tax=Clostridium tetani TaxID=1513 RepID=A0ABY0ER27_CLOTA|nr:phosphomannomutase/phosphoglucomutase [Clostridium tetani]KHO40124.1 phosphomannomutase [Clostridium tetani]RXI57585.1 phosphomannomutase/phosphoglucomutase [Clostridium tetani]RXI72304.1 phosphomannomutase/phosphoglucomutase [Clostridium tetani]CDI48521.1 phosphoglucomutase [Clostridium tetani 12124569]
MENINKSIFRKYDIRGVYGEEVTENFAELLGKTFGSFLIRKGEKKIVVGMDNRKSSPSIKKSLIKGLTSTGVDVIDIGIVVTPIFYYATYLYKIKGGIMVTASHNPAKCNGFKIQFEEGTIYGEELLKIREEMVKGDFIKGNRYGYIIERSPVEEYIKNIEEKIKLGSKKLKVVVDCGNGTAALFAPEILKILGCNVIPLYCTSDSDFPNHFPDPTVEDNLIDLIKKVRIEKADLGIAYDGDGDRIGVVDEKGDIIWGDMLMILFWREILPKYPNIDAIVEVKCSNALIEEIRKLGGKPFFYKTGHSLIKAKMQEIDAPFTGEMSGHMFFRDEYYGFDDALYASARLLRILSNTDKSLGELFYDIPQYFSTPEIRIPCKDEEKFERVEMAKKYFEEKNMDIITIDGVRVNFENGWGLIRASNTGEELILRYESKNKNELKLIKRELTKALG